MHYHDLQAEISALEKQILSYEQLLDHAFSRNAILKETKKIYHQLKILKDKLNGMSESSRSHALTSSL
jgi:hypothetical protein